MFLTLDDTNLQSGMLGIGQLSLSRVQSGPIPTLKIPLVSGVSASRGVAPYTFTRNSTATYIDANGVLQTAGIDVPRFQNGRYLCEPAATNMLSYSELLTNAYWTITRLSIEADAPTGMFKLTNTLTGSCYTKSGNLSLTSGVYYTQSAELMKGNTDFVSMTFASSVSSLLPYAIFNLATGIVTKAQNCTATMYPLASGSYRCAITIVATATVSVTGGLITPCRENSLRTEGVVGDYIYANKIQTETGTKATSYIPTTTVPMDRVGDALHYAVGSVITQGQGSLYCEFWGGNYAGTVRMILNISDGTNSNRLYPYLKDTGGVALIGVTAGVANISVGTVSASSTLNKLLVSYETNSVKLYVNGVLIGIDTSCTIPTNFTTLSAGCSHDNIFQLNSEIGNVKYFKEVLTGAEAIKQTTL